jgi:hypothetical protein
VRIGRLVVGFGRVDPRVLFIPNCPGVTGASDRSNRCKPFVGFTLSELLVPCVFGSCCLVTSWSVWSCFPRFYVGFFFHAGCVWGMFLFQGLEKSLRLAGTFVVRLL